VVQERGVTTVEALPLSVLAELHASLKRYYHASETNAAERQDDAAAPETPDDQTTTMRGDVV
jgi:hypothetical protein